MAAARKSVDWTAQAEADLYDVVTWLRGERPSAAVRFLEALERKIAQVVRFPESGRPIAEAAGDPDEEPVEREVLAMSWRVGYSVRGTKRITILYVLHQVRAFPPIR